jgi:hypothetical protein
MLSGSMPTTFKAQLRSPEINLFLDGLCSLTGALWHPKVDFS